MAVVERASGVKRCRVINGEIFFRTKPDPACVSRISIHVTEKIAQVTKVWEEREIKIVCREKERKRN